MAEAARGSNKLHYRLRARHGDGYRSKLKEAWELALKELDKYRKQVDQAQVDYDRFKKA